MARFTRTMSSSAPCTLVRRQAIAKAPCRGGGTRTSYLAAAGMVARICERAADAATRSQEQVEGAYASSNYWSATTIANNPTNAWNVNTNNGNVNNNNKTNDLYVRAVRAGS